MMVSAAGGPGGWWLVEVEAGEMVLYRFGEFG